MIRFAARCRPNLTRFFGWNREVGLCILTLIIFFDARGRPSTHRIEGSTLGTSTNFASRRQVASYSSPVPFIIRLSRFCRDVAGFVLFQVFESIPFEDRMGQEPGCNGEVRSWCRTKTSVWLVGNLLSPGPTQGVCILFMWGVSAYW